MRLFTRPTIPHSDSLSWKGAIIPNVYLPMEGVMAKRFAFVATKAYSLNTPKNGE